MNNNYHFRLGLCDEIDLPDKDTTEFEVTEFEDDDLDLSDASDNQTVLD